MKHHFPSVSILLNIIIIVEKIRFWDPSLRLFIFKRSINYKFISHLPLHLLCIFKLNTIAGLLKYMILQMLFNFSKLSFIFNQSAGVSASEEKQWIKIWLNAMDSNILFTYYFEFCDDAWAQLEVFLLLMNYDRCGFM